MAVVAVNFAIKDNEGDECGFGFNALVPTDSTTVSAWITALIAKADAIKTEAKALTGGKAGFGKVTASLTLKDYKETPVAAEENERNKRWAIKQVTSYNTAATNKLPCADYSLGVKGKLDITTADTPGKKFVTAWQANAVDPAGGALTVVEICKATA